ncbi:MAG TPA: SLBB domain-containing protein [Syntrophobacter fumaroxidans]|nr:SLBB domain-containing protein [Syntrophobacter fumaroxidans]
MRSKRKMFCATLLSFLLCWNSVCAQQLQQIPSPLAPPFATTSTPVSATTGASPTTTTIPGIPGLPSLTLPQAMMPVPCETLLPGQLPPVGTPPVIPGLPSTAGQVPYLQPCGPGQIPYQPPGVATQLPYQAPGIPSQIPYQPPQGTAAQGPYQPAPGVAGQAPVTQPGVGTFQVPYQQPGVPVQGAPVTQPGVAGQVPYQPSAIPGQVPSLQPGVSLQMPVQQPMVPVQPGYPQPAPSTSRGYPAGQVPYQQPAELAVPPMLPVEPLSPFEEFVAGKSMATPASISFDIKQFGYDLFLNSGSPLITGSPISGTAVPGTTGVPGMPGGASVQTIPGMPGIPGTTGHTGPMSTQFGLPILNVPVSPSYVIGPGDEIRIAVWGSVEGTWDVIVDRDGTISLPKIGIIGVTNMTFQEVKDTLKNEFSKYYQDFQMNVSMGSLKTIRVYVVGNARNPGAYLVTSMSSIVNGLLAAGGPSKAGSMRNIELKRNGETIAVFDLYELLLKGDKTKDRQLMAEDVLYIPPIGSMVGVAGNVERPAIFEMKGKTKLSEAIKMAGGPTADAYLQRIQVERVSQRKAKIFLDVDMQGIKGKQDIFLQDGDIVKVFPISMFVTNRIILKGNVRRPGEYEWKHGMRVKDIIRNFDVLLPDAMLEYALVERLVAPDNHQEYRTFNLREAISGTDRSQNILLEPYDTITVYSKWEMQERERVRVSGAVNRPGDFEFRENMKLSDLLKLSGGLKKTAAADNAEITRVVPTETGPRTEQIQVNPTLALAGDPDFDIPLHRDDYLTVKSVPDWQLYRKVAIYGEVKYPGDYALQKGEKLSSLLERAGGFTDKAYKRGSSLFRESVRQLQQRQMGELIDMLGRQVLANSAANLMGEMTPGEAEFQATQAKQQKLFLDTLKTLQAKGRVVVQLDEPRKLKGTPFDIEVEEGDQIYIPINPRVVQVIGAVYNQTAFVYEPGRNFSYYIDQAGGYSPTADKGNVFILKADGSAVQPGRGIFWCVATARWQTGANGRLEPGDTVIVPDKLDKVAWMRNFKDLTTVLYQIAVGTGVLLRL